MSDDDKAKRALRCLQELQELSDGWIVQLNNTHSGEWTLSLVNKRGLHPHEYRGTDLARIVTKAWAGEPDGRA